MEPVSQLSNFRDRHRPRLEMLGTLAQHPFENEGNGHTAGRHRRGHAPAGGYRQLQQGIQTAEPAALRLVEKLTPEMRRRQVDYRFAQLKSRQVNTDSNLRPAVRKFSAAPSRRSTTETTFKTVQPNCRAWSTACITEPPVVVTSSTRITFDPLSSRPSMRWSVPCPLFSLRTKKPLIGFSGQLLAHRAATIGIAPVSRPPIYSTSSALIASNNRSANKAAPSGSNIVLFMSTKKLLDCPEASRNSRLSNSDCRRIMAINRSRFS